MRGRRPRSASEASAVRSAERAVHAGALRAHEDALADGGPGRLRRAAVGALVVALQQHEFAQARRRELIEDGDHGLGLPRIGLGLHQNSQGLWRRPAAGEEARERRAGRGSRGATSRVDQLELEVDSKEEPRARNAVTLELSAVAVAARASRSDRSIKYLRATPPITWTRRVTSPTGARSLSLSRCLASDLPRGGATARLPAYAIWTSVRLTSSSATLGSVHVLKIIDVTMYGSQFDDGRRSSR